MSPKRRQYGTGSVSQRKSDGLWIGRIEGGTSPQGTRRRIVVSAKTKAECERKLRDKHRQILTDGIPAAGTSRATVKSWALEWLPRHARKVRPSTYTTDRGAVNKWIIPTIGQRRLADLTPADLRALREAITGAGRSTTTALHAHKTLLTMLKAAIVEGHQVPERILHVEKPRKAANDRTALPLEDALAILKLAADSHDGPRWVAALLQGMRQGEVLGLTWDAINTTEGYIDVSWQLQSLPYLDKADHSKGFRIPDGFEARHLRGAQHLTRPKTAAGSRAIPLVPWMTAALDKVRQEWTPNPYGLAWADAEGRPIRPEDDRQRWHDLQKAANVQHPSGRPYHVHETRHTTATLLLAAGVDRAIIEAILGQAVLVESYLHVGRAQALAALEAIAGPLGLDVSAKPSAIP